MLLTSLSPGRSNSLYPNRYCGSHLDPTITTRVERNFCFQYCSAVPDRNLAQRPVQHEALRSRILITMALPIVRSGWGRNQLHLRTLRGERDRGTGERSPEVGSSELVRPQAVSAHRSNRSLIARASTGPSGVCAVAKMVPPSRVFEALCACWLTSSEGSNERVQALNDSKMARQTTAFTRSFLIPGKHFSTARVACGSCH